MKLLKAHRPTYEIDKFLGDGLTSEVVRAFRRDSKSITQQQVALKLIKSRKDVQILKKEFENLNRVQSKYCVKVLAWENFKNGPALVLEYVDGVTLERLVRSGLVTEDLALEILCQVRLGVISLHRVRVYHGDLNLKNIMISRHGLVKLIDFGFGFKDCQLLTPEFASAERLAGAIPSEKSDWVSFQKISKHLLSEPQSLQTLVKDSPRGRRRRRLAEAVSQLESQASVRTKRISNQSNKTAKPLWGLRALAVFCFCLFLLCPDSRSQSHPMVDLELRSQKWFQYSLNGSPFRFGPRSKIKLRKGRYELQLKILGESKTRSLKIGNNRTFLLNPGDNIL